LKNIRFEDLGLFKEGENYFVTGKYEKALESFTQFSEKYPNGRTLVAGRKAISLMELNRFDEAKEYLENILKASVMPFPDWERHYNCLYAECLRALGYIKNAEEVCFDIEKKYTESNGDLEKIFKKVSIHPNLDVLRTYMDWNERKECLQAMEGIIEILSNVKNGNNEEAIEYSLNLINCKNNYSIKPYLVLKDFYEKTGKYHYCLHLLQKLEKSMVPLAERNNGIIQILEVYKKSPDFMYSIYSPEPVKVTNLAPIEKLIKGMGEKIFSLADSIKYTPILNLDKYFAREPQLILA
jgi:tetratricopeptide (TPR) repeat protein